VKINFTARDTINYQHHQFVAEADVLSPINSKSNIHLSTARFFENNQDITKKLGVLDWTESKKNFKITLPQNKEELKKEIEQAITTKISDARDSDSLVEVAKISGEIDTLEGHLDEVSAQPITTSDELVQPLSLQELIAQKDLKGIEEHIKSGIENYLDSDTFKNYLDFARQFRQYSYRNKILIKGQNPKASLVAGYRAWQDKGRQVQRGEKALKIFVPSMAAKKDKEGNYSRDKEGNIIKEVKGFYLASVYDVSQTKGEPIPKPIYELEENINNPQKFDWYIKAITELSPVPIQFSEIEGTAKGFFVPAEKQITIRPGMSQAQTTKTMLHEVTHSILHDNDVPVFGSSEYARQEIEAESVAYMVANSLGIETQDYSFGYLASWTDLGLSLENLEKSLDLICNQAQKMMGELDNILKQIPIEEQTQEVKPEQKQSNPRPKSSIKMRM
uniref:ArdC-like ssDNA-binding domain-containing protein n=1 Tax=Lactococcus lactis TaxID=1358 RepID=UPI0022E69F80